ncbi:hypothetical protein HMPREF1092_00279 [Clostridium thermobutyricum]|uniref:Uncharacterized protein n=1 Tax=Clostridium thermobutyricum TaxID=29372 RepID=N9XTR9_9CLOT|nr:hypothetical protein [Clostridium thermobutyricum]ENZ03093.1 hypothetical protein HMPREF1092_00279 [Clostridium thermobutyricum]
MNNTKKKKGIIIGIVIVVIIIIIALIATFVGSIGKKESANKENNYKNSYQYKMKREKDLEVLKGFYGNYIVTGVSGTSPSIELPQDQLKTLENNFIGSQVVINENNFSIKYNDTKSVNGINFSNVNINKPYYEVNQTNDTMFNSIYKTTLQKIGVKANSAYFINVGAKNDYEQEIIKNDNDSLLIYSQGAFFKLEPAAKILAKKNAELERYANDALKFATGTDYKYVFPVQQILKDGKLAYKKVDNSELFMCSNKNDSVDGDKDTMFITLTKGVVTPDQNKDNKDNKNNNNNKDKKDNKDNKDQDKNAGKPFYNFTISTFGMMNKTQSGKQIVGKVYIDGSVEVTHR